MSTVRTNDANTANTNRHVRFKVEPQDAGDYAAYLFASLKGYNAFYPFYGQIKEPTTDQELAQLRLSLVTRVLTRYAILVGVQLAADTGTNDDGAVILTYEQDEMGVFYNNDWGSNADPYATDKHSAGDIVDTVGTGGLVSGPKTKDGLNSSLDDLANVSYDDGVTGPFGALSTSGNITLPSGEVTSGSPTLAAGGTPSGLQVTYLAW